ncbi:MAG: hypothetical protein RMK97_07290 [Sutterellaceae bacterium]|nr:hypothetical protein [Burkholderiaceae bacterium]MDW8430289.1 hypothetical protein [Sutterellaceae bacterium]
MKLKAGPERKCADHFGQQAVRQFTEVGRNQSPVARGLEMSPKTSANGWLGRVGGQPLATRVSRQPVDEVQVTLTPRRQEGAVG